MIEEITDEDRQRLDKMIESYQAGDAGHREWTQFRLNLSGIEKKYVRKVIAREGKGKSAKPPAKPRNLNF